MELEQIFWQTVEDSQVQLREPGLKHTQMLAAHYRSESQQSLLAAHLKSQMEQTANYMYWKEQQSTLSLLSCLPQTFLCAPQNLSCVKEFFSAAGHIICLKPTTVDKLAFLNNK